MPQDFSALRADVVSTKNYIDSSGVRAPVEFLNTFYADLDSFLIAVLDHLELICTDENLRPEDKPQETKRNVYDEIQRVRQCRENLHSTDVPENLYFLLEDIKRDLGISLDIGLEAGTQIFIYEVQEKFKVIRTVISGAASADDIDAHIISFPRSELRRPLSFSLLIHECFHATDLTDDVEQILQETNDDIPVEKIEEICVDLLSLNYMGPIYGLILANIPDKIGQHEAYVHPTQQTRLDYILRYINFLEGSDDNSHELFRVVQDAVKNDIIDRIDDGFADISLQNFDTIQSKILDLCAESGIPTYASERCKLREYLGMPEADDKVVNEKLHKFLLDSDPDREISLPVKPALLFNLLMLVDDYEGKDLNDIILQSFKKWYVVRKTREVYRDNSAN